jgi:hypothetical protein
MAKFMRIIETANPELQLFNQRLVGSVAPALGMLAGVLQRSQAELRAYHSEVRQTHRQQVALARAWEASGSSGFRSAAAAAQARAAYEGFRVTSANTATGLGSVAQRGAEASAALSSVAAAAATIAAPIVIEQWSKMLKELAVETLNLNAARADEARYLGENQAAYDQQYKAYFKLLEQLPQLDDAFAVSTEATEANARVLLSATRQAIEFAKEMRSAKKPVDEFTQNMLKAGYAIRAQQERLREGGKSVGEFIDRLAEMNEVVEDKDPVTALGSLMEQFKLLAASGEYSARALVESFAPRVKDLMDEASRLGISLPIPLREFDDVLTRSAGPGGAIHVAEQFAERIRKEIPDAAAIATTALKSGFGDIRDVIRDARGDLTRLGQDLEDLSKEVVIKIKVDDRDLQEWRRRNGGSSGEPATGGQVP